ncbi:Ohr family peroxiredoxin [Mycolicibacter senuensis]|uniref:Organic hydroperoxide resistance protein n=1 Tax=Mycolicibacter senuensis TaxID=386913 RepID=A0A7I9XMY8_9MYCO|nr:Ohr family peroxiredoxin [Mycolicibacter senuensis]MDQ2628711.1 Ohr family peroxiredoxin [Actinomycetota bacterium]ORW66352.1 organic hydroperoxide resistance protein [Mycolicibacter senuensis]GFG71098.1 organic hydroperoxide resistance protein [Mycolicibacter senuensis]
MSIKVVFATESTATGGGRDGHVRSATGRIDLDTRPPRELGGDGAGTNPEELFSAAYAACFLGALRLVARRSAVALDDATDVTVQVALGKDVATEEFALTGTIIGNLPGLAQAIADDLMAQAHEVCPYSRATRGNAEFIVSAKV